MTTSLNVAVLMGGASAEAGVSRNSAREVAAALRQAGHEATLIEIDRGLAAALTALAPDVVFPVLHGPPGEDGTIQGFLETLSLAYVGSGVRGSALAMDKRVAKLIFREVGLPVAPDAHVAADEDPASAAERVRAILGDRVVIKPLSQGSAIGVTRLANGGDLVEPLRAAQRYGGVLVEPFVLGREITVGVFDPHDGAPRALPVIEIRTATDQWYDFENRYKVGASEHIIPAPLPDDVNAHLQDIAVAAHIALGLDDLSRADFLVTDTDEIVLLEVNTLPGMTETSLLPKAAASAGFSYPELCQRMVELAMARAMAQSR
jgi:D-alanine-D-alanine ligase